MSAERLAHAAIARISRVHGVVATLVSPVYWVGHRHRCPMPMDEVEQELDADDVSPDVPTGTHATRTWGGAAGDARRVRWCGTGRPCL